MSRMKNRRLIIVLCLIVCLGTVCISYAYVKYSEKKVENVFSLRNIECSIDEEFDSKVKKNVIVNNTCEAAAYIRTEINATWMTEDGTKVYAEKPILNDEYSIRINENDWFLGDDGYYYHKNKVNGGKSTNVLIEEAKLNEGITPPTGYYLSIEIISTAVQANPEEAVTEVWPAVDVSSGKLVKK